MKWMLMVFLMCLGFMRGYSKDALSVDDKQLKEIPKEFQLYSFSPNDVDLLNANKLLEIGKYPQAYGLYMDYLVNLTEEFEYKDYINALIGKCLCEYFVCPNSAPIIYVQLKCFKKSTLELSNDKKEIFYKVMMQPTFYKVIERVYDEIMPYD